MLDLESAIKHAEEVEKIKNIDGMEARLQEQDRYADECFKCAEEHRQLAEWLKDYKRLKTIESGKARCTTCKHYGTYAVECRECYAYSRWESKDEGFD